MKYKYWIQTLSKNFSDLWNWGWMLKPTFLIFSLFCVCFLANFLILDNNQISHSLIGDIFRMLFFFFIIQITFVNLSISFMIFLSANNLWYTDKVQIRNQRESAHSQYTNMWHLIHTIDGEKNVKFELKRTERKWLHHLSSSVLNAY